ncbi:putative mitochondrial protein, partial [Mucuna pruriens]
MQEELDQFHKNDVWKLVSPANDKSIIGTKWIFKKKKDQNGKVMRNKASQTRSHSHFAIIFNSS